MPDNTEQVLKAIAGILDAKLAPVKSQLDRIEARLANVEQAVGAIAEKLLTESEIRDVGLRQGDSAAPISQA